MREEYLGFIIEKSVAGFWVINWDYEGETSLGLFSTKTAAIEYINKLI